MHDLPEFEPPVHYRPEVAAVLLEHGVTPREGTQPRLVYQFLRAIYTFEIRERKARRRELERFFGPQPLGDYAGQIERLRAKYSLLRKPLARWIRP
jgi:hypothetical protein